MSKCITNTLSQHQVSSQNPWPSSPLQHDVIYGWPLNVTPSCNQFYLMSCFKIHQFEWPTHLLDLLIHNYCWRDQINLCFERQCLCTISNRIGILFYLIFYESNPHFRSENMFCVAIEIFIQNKLKAFWKSLRVWELKIARWSRRLNTRRSS